MRKHDTLQFDWPETGKLKILMRGSHSAVLRYSPSEAAIKKALSKAARGCTTEGEGKAYFTPPTGKTTSCGCYFDFTGISGLHNRQRTGYNIKRRPLNNGKPSFDNRGGTLYERKNNEEFAIASAESRRHLKAGMLDRYAFDLRIMGSILRKEGRYKDELKVLMLAFYIELDGALREPYIDLALVAMIMKAAMCSGLDKYQINELYMDTVRADATPNHIMTVNDSMYLIELCLTGREEEALDLLACMIGK